MTVNWYGVSNQGTQAYLKATWMIPTENKILVLYNVSLYSLQDFLFPAKMLKFVLYMYYTSCWMASAHCVLCISAV